MNHRAIVYRELHNIPADWGTAVNVQAMVFGNMDDNSATGVAFSRNPSTGARELYGEFLINAQGEDVVAGMRTPHPISEAARQRSSEGRPSQGTGQRNGLRREIRRAVAGGGDAGGVRRVQGLCGKAGSALPRDAGHGVHGRARQIMDAANAGGQAHRAGRAEDRRRHGERGAHHAGRSLVADRPGFAGPIAASDRRPRDRTRHSDQRPAGLARRGLRRDRVWRRGGDGACRPGAQGDSGARRDQPGGHWRHARRASHSHRARRHDLARRRGGPRHGEALRHGRRRLANRLRGPEFFGRRPALSRGRHDHRRRLFRPGDRRRGQDAAPGADRRIRRPDGLGRRRRAG